MILSTNDLTESAHIIIIIGVSGLYLKSKRVENLIDTQQKTIEALQAGFDACRDRLATLEKMVKNKDKYER